MGSHDTTRCGGVHTVTHPVGVVPVRVRRMGRTAPCARSGLCRTRACAENGRPSDMIFARSQVVPVRARRMAAMTLCKNCQAILPPGIPPRQKYCSKCAKHGNRGMRKYHSAKGEYVSAGMKNSSLRKLIIQTRKGCVL